MEETHTPSCFEATVVSTGPPGHPIMEIRKKKQYGGNIVAILGPFVGLKVFVIKATKPTCEISDVVLTHSDTDTEATSA